MDLNSNLRLEILEYSLFIEKLINDLLLISLGIYHRKESMKLINNKGRLTFQNKIDLLFDISIFSKNEILEFELLMNIRNKFLHDINCNSYLYLLSQFDKGIVKRFKKYLDDENSINNENACKKACSVLFQKNIKTIREKIATLKLFNDKKHKFLILQNEHKMYYVDLLHECLEKVSIAVENANLENPNVSILGCEILNIVQGITSRFNSKTNRFSAEEPSDLDEIVKSFFGIKGELVEIPNSSDFNLGNSN